MQAGFDGPLGNPHPIGDLGYGQVGVEPERDDDRVVGVERGERASEQVAHGDGARHFHACRQPIVAVGWDGHDDRSPASRAKSVAATVHEDPPEPRFEPVPFAQAGEPPPRDDGRVVDGVLGFDRVAEDDGRQTVLGVEPAIEQRGERGRAIVHRSLHRAACQHSSPSAYASRRLDLTTTGRETFIVSLEGTARIIPAMCEQFVARAAEPFRIDELWPFAETLERFGLAGFGWGAAWFGVDGRLHSHRDVRAFRDDADGAARVGQEYTTTLLVHLRRPSRLSTLQLPDAQPFEDPTGRFVFSHNGDLRDWRRRRAEYQRQGRIHGRADTEVAARWLEDAWTGDAPGRLLTTLHERFGGQANLAVVTGEGTPAHYAGNSENPVFSFRLGAIGMLSTGIYSLDRSLFRFVAPGATDRHVVRHGTVVELDQDGTPMTAS